MHNCLFMCKIGVDGFAIVVLEVAEALVAYFGL